MDSARTQSPAGENAGARDTAPAFDAGFNISLSPSSLGFDYGPGVFGPEVECRRLKDIRASLLDPQCDGPDPVYGIAMDVGRSEDRADLERRMLLYGAVVYAAGQLGEEPVRSQGHVHKIAPHSGWPPPELFEIWEGRAIVYAQEFAADDPGRCAAVIAEPGDLVVVPPGWAHAVINADPRRRMAFGAWCDRQYGFVYDAVRARGGLAHFPRLAGERIEWAANPRYRPRPLWPRRARSYPELGLRAGVPIYRQYLEDAGSVEWITRPADYAALWPKFEP